MAYTRAAAEASLLRRVRGWFKQVQFDWQTQDGTNADLNDPFALALSQMGFGPANFAAVTDTDLVPLTARNFERFFCIAELAALKAVQGSLTAYSTRNGGFGTQQSDQAANLANVITDREINIRRRWGDRGGGVVISTTAPRVWGTPLPCLPARLTETERLRGLDFSSLP